MHDAIQEQAGIGKEIPFQQKILPAEKERFLSEQEIL
jgi:hypothetical protein